MMPNKILTKTLFAAAACAVLAGSPAMAADIPVKAPIVKAPVIVPWTWTGFYIGGNVGYSWGKWDSTSLTAIFPGPPGLFSNTASPDVDGWVAGFQAGYNWQVDYWVLGLEADIQWTGEKASLSHTISLGPIPVGDSTLRATGTNTNDWGFSWFGTFRGRVGWTTSDHWLFYVTGGLAYGHAKFSNVGLATVTLTSPVLGTVVTNVSTGFSDSTTRIGWTVGGGIEKALDRNWSVKGEYLYVDLGSHTFGAGTALATNVRLRDHIVRIGINYKFDHGPVVARY